MFCIGVDLGQSRDYTIIAIVAAIRLLVGGFPGSRGRIMMFVLGLSVCVWSAIELISRPL